MWLDVFGWRRELDVVGYVWDEHEDGCGVLSWFVMNFTYYLLHCGRVMIFGDSRWLPPCCTVAKHLAPSWWVQLKSELRMNVGANGSLNRLHRGWFFLIPKSSSTFETHKHVVGQNKINSQSTWTQVNTNSTVINVQVLLRFLARLRARNVSAPRSNGPGDVMIDAGVQVQPPPVMMAGWNPSDILSDLVASDSPMSCCISCVEGSWQGSHNPCLFARSLEKVVCIIMWAFVLWGSYFGKAMVNRVVCSQPMDACHWTSNDRTKICCACRKLYATRMFFDIAAAAGRLSIYTYSDKYIYTSRQRTHTQM